MTRRVSSVTLKRGRRGTCQRSRNVILASISCGRAAATIGLERSPVNKDVPLLSRARRAARSPLFNRDCVFASSIVSPTDQSQVKIGGPATTDIKTPHGRDRFDL